MWESANKTHGKKYNVDSHNNYYSLIINGGPYRTTNIVGETIFTPLLDI